MSWKDLLQIKEETIVLPWIGGRSLRSSSRTWHIQGKNPREHGWYRFKLSGRVATLDGAVDPEPTTLQAFSSGYLVGDRFVGDSSRVNPDPAKIAEQTEPVFLLDPGLERFVRIRVGSVFEGGPFIFSGLEMPLGPEADVLDCFLSAEASVDRIPGVSPALDAAFRMETFQREEARRRREENERRLREEEARRAEAERREALIRQIGTGAGRRELATVDFAQAARAALAVGGAEYLDSRNAHLRNEKVVTFRFQDRRFECTCDARTLRIIYSGICLQDHNTGERGDQYFTLESLPGVIAQAQRERRLVVFRHVDRNYDDDEDD